MHRALPCLLLVSVVSVLPSLQAPARAAPPPLQDLDAYLERALAAWGVPGLAIGVVQDGAVLLQRGYGARRADQPGAVDEHTSFAIASLSKGFTAALSALLVERGQLAFDDPVQRHLPEFAVADAQVSRELTLRDLLAHRSGLQPEVDALWAFTGYQRPQLLERLRFAGQAAPVRSQFTYQNVHYLVAGEALARRGGRSWSELLRRELLQPLGMSDSATTLRERGARPNRAAPHTDRDGRAAVIAEEDADAIAPAAAMHASAADMNRWLLLLLGRGTLAGRALLKPQSVAELFTPQMLDNLSPAERALYPESHLRAYGLGFVLQDYRGSLVAWNTGGLHGMACSLALLPERGVGVVVLTNGPRVSLPEALVFRVLDAFLGAPPKDWSGLRLTASLARRARQKEAEQAQARARIPGTRPTLALARYAGRYQQPLLGAVTVSLQGDALTLRLAQGIHGALQHWHHDSFQVTWSDPQLGTSRATFQLDAAGAPTRLVLEELGEFSR